MSKVRIAKRLVSFRRGPDVPGLQALVTVTVKLVDGKELSLALPEYLFR